MGDVRQEPSMEDILASIKRIIADDGAAVVPPRPRRPVQDSVAAAPPVDVPPPPCDVLELTEPAPALVSPDAVVASKQSLDLLSALVVRGAGPSENTLEGMVREMLRPMLKEWLDARLPEVVETLVAREIARITGKQG
ncbi:DUF2497 domain-containing protein [Sphingomonas arantia]|uniref:DUF2497 domain-containing protein n=1 Tax=Sphingomonas arantia TaxID=1460676 RepID=A0ABW4TYX7_9SPHN